MKRGIVVGVSVGVVVGAMLAFGAYRSLGFAQSTQDIEAHFAARTQARETEQAAFQRDQEQREQARQRIELAPKTGITEDQITWEPGFEIHSQGTLGAGYHATFGAWHLECIPSPVEPDAWDVRVYTDAPEFNEFQACVYMHGTAAEARAWCVRFLRTSSIVLPGIFEPNSPADLASELRFSGQ